MTFYILLNFENIISWLRYLITKNILPNNYLENSCFQVWFMSENVSLSRCEALYRAGYDSLGNGLRGSLADPARLAERLAEVALLRLTKHLFQLSEAGRLAAVPTDLVAELAARRAPAATLADAGNVSSHVFITQNFREAHVILVASHVLL